MSFVFVCAMLCYASLYGRILVSPLASQRSPIGVSDTIDVYMCVCWLEWKGAKIVRLCVCCVFSLVCWCSEVVLSRSFRLISSFIQEWKWIGMYLTYRCRVAMLCTYVYIFIYIYSYGCLCVCKYVCSVECKVLATCFF